jgi:hypothetical protein
MDCWQLWAKSAIQNYGVCLPSHQCKVCSYVIEVFTSHACPFYRLLTVTDMRGLSVLALQTAAQLGYIKYCIRST